MPVVTPCHDGDGAMAFGLVAATTWYGVSAGTAQGAAIEAIWLGGRGHGKVRVAFIVGLALSPCVAMRRAVDRSTSGLPSHPRHSLWRVAGGCVEGLKRGEVALEEKMLGSSSDQR